MHTVALPFFFFFSCSRATVTWGMGNRTHRRVFVLSRTRQTGRKKKWGQPKRNCHGNWRKIPMGPNGASSGCQFRKIATETRRQHIQLHPRTCAATQQQELLAVPKESSLGPLPNEPDQSEASLGNKGCAWKDRDIHAVGLFPNSALRPTGGRVCGKTSENLAGEYLCPGRPLLSTSPAFFPPKKFCLPILFHLLSSHQRKSYPKLPSQWPPLVSLPLAWPPRWPQPPRLPARPPASLPPSVPSPPSARPLSP